MTLVKGFSNFVLAMMMLGSFANAQYIKPGPRDPGRPAPYPGPGNGGGNYGPQPQPGYPGYDQQSVTIPVNQYITNSTFDLTRSLMQYQGYQVQQVHVYVTRAREVDSSVDLVINGVSEDSRAVVVSQDILLVPRNISEVGRSLGSIGVYARGEMLIDSIVVDLVSNQNQMNGEFMVALNLPYLPPQARLDLTPYIDMNSYYGYVVRGIQVTASSRTGGYAGLDVLINGFMEGSLSFNPYQTTQVLYSRQNLVLGSSFGSLVVVPRGDSSIAQVSLILSRQ
jgi:hypothetical protein